MKSLSIVIPALDAASTIANALAAVGGGGPVAERIVVDGGSTDDTVSAAQAAGARIVRSAPGRGLQLAAGAEVARGEWLLFLHADTLLDPGWAAEVEAFAADTDNAEKAAVFRFALDDRSPAAVRLESIVAWRSRALGLPYGDQGLLISRTFYRSLGGFRPMPLYEDVDIVRRIGRRRITLLKTRAVTSAVRYRQSGFWLRSVRNLFCLSLYWLGLPPAVILRIYG